MKKYLSLFLITIILLSLCACTAKDSENTDNNKTTSNNSTVLNTDDNNISVDSTDITEENNSSNSTVFIRYYRQKNELPYNDEMENIINEIKTCTDKPKTEFEHKIGSISIRHNGDTPSEDIARIYVGKDDQIYAQYIDSNDEKIAYKLDIEAFGLE